MANTYTNGSTSVTYNKSSMFIDPFLIGFDKINSQIEEAFRWNSGNSFPPYNVRKIDSDSYVIDLALAGYLKQDISITEENGILTIEGSKEDPGDDFIYKGIANRKFKRVFSLAEHVYVDTAHLQHGVLHISLKRDLPEEKKPKSIAIDDFVNSRREDQ